jgi:hypothetical protein
MSFCTAVDLAGYAFAYNGTAWSALGDIDPNANAESVLLFSVSCPTAAFCTAVDTNGDALVFPVPVNTAVPTISSGSPTVGATLTEAHGSWTNSPAAYYYQWTDCNASGAACVPIPGAVGQTYVVGSGDAGDTIRVTEAARNAVGTSTPVSSTQTALVPATTTTTTTTATAPVNVTPPVVVSIPAVGLTVGCSGGSWSGSAPQTYTYQWLLGGVPIVDATGQYYVVTAVDAGRALACSVTAKNSVGSLTATSASVTVPIPPVTGKIGVSRVSKAVVSGTSAKAVVKCVGAATQKCTITLKMTIVETVRAGRLLAVIASAKTTKRTVSVGARTVTLVGGHSETVHVKLNATGVHLLAARGRLSVKLATTRRSSTGTAIAVGRQTLAFKNP